MSVYVCSISHDLLCYMNSKFLADSFAGVYIVMLMNGSGDDEYCMYMSGLSCTV